MNNVLATLNSLWKDVGTLGKFVTDRDWEEGKISISYLSKSIGLYKATLNGKVVYIGKATEWNNGGLRKRLRDYVRKNNSARNYPSGLNMFNNKDEIHIQVLIVGDCKDSVNTTECLENLFIEEHKPEWNMLDKNSGIC